MASESANKPVNGNYGTQQQYIAAELPSSPQISNHATINSTAGTFGSENANVPATTGNPSSGANESNSTIPKDEVGWYFVEQYYTTLSRNPERLHLFYSKRSQFVSGVEAKKVSVSVGQRAINERIKELGIQDCKVRVTNVDSQESFKNIVVQVIGEMSNKAEPHRKFVQTFVLAEQPNGYFVLNDIFRYIIEDEDEELENEVPASNDATLASNSQAETSNLTNSDNSTVEQKNDLEQVDKILQEEILDKNPDSEEPPVDEPASSGNTVDELAGEEHAEDVPVVAVETEKELDDEKIDGSLEAVEKVVESEEVQPEKPKDPDPTPVASPPKSVETQSDQSSTTIIPSKPAAAKTWANLVAANPVAAPAIPGPVSTTTPAPSQPKATQQAPAQAVTPSTSASDDAPIPTQQNGGAGWQTAGQDYSKRQTRQSISGNVEKDNVLGYVKNVTDRVDASLLKTTLQQYGKLAYFDVSRQKNCAFVEFADAAGYNGAVAANPHSIGGEQIYVEERRPRPNAYGGGFNGRGGIRGGRGGTDGRPGNQGRGGFPKDGSRGGGFVARGRGGNLTPRGGRGQPQPV